MARIGVLGGIGPEATGTWYLKLIAELQRRGGIACNEDFPQIVINSVPAPELVFETVGEDALDPYERGLIELDAIGPDFLLMVCNTIHLFYDRLAACVRAPLLDLRVAVRERLASDGYDSVCVLGTPETITRGLYRFPGVEYVDPDTDQLAELTAAIDRFNRGEERERQIETSLRIARSRLAAGAQVVLLACTEFAVMLGETEIPRLNTIDILVDATVDRLENAKRS